jgi:hypothetical protein
MRAWLLTIMVICLICVTDVSAGPPFVTDDPEPVELHHWEVYIASHQEYDPSGNSGTLPHIELNYGAVPNLQIHLILPFAFRRPSGKNIMAGYGDTEIGVKYRFVQEAPDKPMAGAFPLVEIPTGNQNRGLSSGQFQFFLPIWIQKSWGDWTSYGGGGYNINPGQGNRNYWLFGWEIQKDLSQHLTIGGEIFGTTPMEENGDKEIDFNLGGQYNFDEGHHLLFSAGRSIQGDVDLACYLAFQWTFGPRGTEAGARIGYKKGHD